MEEEIDKLFDRCMELVPGIRDKIIDKSERTKKQMKTWRRNNPELLRKSRRKYYKKVKNK